MKRLSAVTRCTRPCSIRRHSAAGMMRGIRSKGISRSVPAPSSSFAPYTAKVMPTRRKITSASWRRERIISAGWRASQAA